jgi:hypothetical protein
MIQMTSTQWLRAVLECVNEFTRTIVDLYEAEYLRPPNQSEVQHILVENEARVFLGMLDSIDYMLDDADFLAVQWPIMVSIKVTRANQLSSLK